MQGSSRLVVLLLLAGQRRGALVTAYLPWQAGPPVFDIEPADIARDINGGESDGAAESFVTDASKYAPATDWARPAAPVPYESHGPVLRSKEMTAEEFSDLVRLLQAAKQASTGAAGTGGGGGPEMLTYSTLSFPAKGLTRAPYVVRGQRDPEIRHQLLGVDFAGKILLDIGCNAGGMVRNSVLLVGPC